MQKSVVLVSLFVLAIACSSSSSSTTATSPTCGLAGAACSPSATVTGRSETCCAETNCIAGTCKAAIRPGSPCTADVECQDGSFCVGGADGGAPAADAGSSAKVCVQGCTLNGQYECEANDTVSLCDGKVRTAVAGTCASCQVAEATTSSLADYYFCNMNDIPLYATPGYPCNPSTEMLALPACNPERTATLVCRDNHWSIYVTCSGATPTCGHQLAGEGTCPVDSATGCLGCIK